MRDESGRIAAAWRAAAADLGILLTSPVTLRGPTDADMEFIALVHDFGALSGTLLCTLADDPPAFALAVAHGYNVYALSPEFYSEYRRADFIELLNDWGWFGEGLPPSWYNPDSVSRGPTQEEVACVLAEMQRIGVGSGTPFGPYLLPFRGSEEFLAWLHTIPSGVGLIGLDEHLGRLASERQVPYLHPNSRDVAHQ